jgi:GntR family transcriptional regulator
MTFDKDSSIPLRAQVSYQLRSSISNGDLKPGDQLPSERKLAEHYKISRVTVRAALNELEYEGLIFSRPGKGRYVSKPMINQQLIQLTGFSEDVQNLNLQSTSRILSREVIRASAELTSKLQLTPGDRVFVIVRLRLVNGNPMAIEQAYLPLTYCPEILEQDFEKGSLYAYLRQCGLDPKKARQTLAPDIPTAEERRLLGIQGNVAVMRMERTTYLINNKPIEYVRSVYRGDKYRFNVVLNSDSQSGVSGEAI